MWIIINEKPYSAFEINDISGVYILTKRSNLFWYARDRNFLDQRWLKKVNEKLGSNFDQISINEYIQDKYKDIPEDLIFGYFFSFTYKGSIQYSNLYDTGEEAREVLDRFLSILNKLEGHLIKLDI